MLLDCVHNLIMIMLRQKKIFTKESIRGSLKMLHINMCGIIMTYYDNMPYNIVRCVTAVKMLIFR